MSEVGDAAMAILGDDDPDFRAALAIWREDCRRFGNEVEWRDAINYRRGWKDAQKNR